MQAQFDDDLRRQITSTKATSAVHVRLHDAAKLAAYRIDVPVVA